MRRFFVSGGVVLLVLSLYTAIVAIAGHVLAAEEEPNPEVLTGMWACQSPNGIDNSECIESDQMCGGASRGTNRAADCSSAWGGYECSHNPSHCYHWTEGPGHSECSGQGCSDPSHISNMCEFGFCVDVYKPGTCSDPDDDVSSTCRECKYLVCMTGTAHTTWEYCRDNVAACPMVGWHTDACKP